MKSILSCTPKLRLLQKPQFSLSVVKANGFVSPRKSNRVLSTFPVTLQTVSSSTVWGECARICCQSGAAAQFEVDRAWGWWSGWLAALQPSLAIITTWRRSLASKWTLYYNFLFRCAFGMVVCCSWHSAKVEGWMHFNLARRWNIFLEVVCNLTIWNETAVLQLEVKNVFQQASWFDQLPSQRY